jgi:hypothetical protein
MSRIRKFRAGPQMDPTEAIRAIAAGNYIMFNGKPVHPGWAGSWRVRMLAEACQAGAVRFAFITPEWREKHL